MIFRIGYTNGMAAFGIALLMLSLPGQGAGTQPEVDARLAARLKKVFPDLQVSRVSPAPLPGLFEVLVGTDIFYMTADGRYLLQGDLLDLDARRNVTEQQRSVMRIKKISAVPLADMIEFAPANPKHVLYVFTDIQCGYCRRLHRDMPEINKRGIAVRYLAFPRAGVGSATFTQMESVWCSDDRRQALTAAKAGAPVSPKTCANPVGAEFALGETLGIHGTPAIFTSEGRLLPGYMPPAELLQAVTEKDR
jgi:thiol:disulfide interchange protein DsbC